MKRDLDAMATTEFDVVVVGGGIFGANIAWDAALRGLTVALLEQSDFAHATSANSLKMVHGGIRYLQHGDIPRIRESSHERRSLLRVAPHIVEPLPILIPTYGHGMKGKELLATGMWLYDLLTCDRNRGIRDPSRRIPAGRVLSRERVLARYPSLPTEGLTGGALFHDAQMYNPTRLVLAFVEGAERHGAVVANHAKVEATVERDGRVVGVRATDMMSGTEFVVRGRYVVNATGPWGSTVVPDNERLSGATFSRDTAFVVHRRLTGGEALALLAKTHDPDALLSRNARHIFLVPWRDYTLVGVWHGVHQGSPESFVVGEDELRGYVDEINSAYPAAQLDVSEVSIVNAGLVLFGDRQVSAEHLSYGKRSLLIDHEKVDGRPGLVSVVGVRYTVARGIAEKTVDLVEQRLKGRRTRCRTETEPVPGGDFDSLDEVMRRMSAGPAASLEPSIMARLVRNYGTEVGVLLGHGRSLERLGETEHLEAEVQYAIQDEMAQTLADVVFRRTDLGTGSEPTSEVLERTAEIAGSLLDWSVERRRTEIEAVRDRFRIPARPIAADS